MKPTIPVITNRICFAGSGECKKTATHAMDDGSGGTAYICAHHLEELEAWEKIFEGLPPEKLKRLEEEIEKAEKKQK